MSDSHSDPGPMFPLIGTYVVLAIDPGRTLEALDDPEVALVTENIKPKLYVGYVSRSESFLDHLAPFQSFRIHLLREGLPPQSTEKCIEADMCIPVLPATDHPSSREALRPSRPLPWSNCYHSSFDSTVIRVPTVYADADKAIKAPHIEIARHDQIVAEDRRRAALTRQSHQAAAPPAEKSNHAGACSSNHGDNDSSSMMSEGADSSHHHSDTGSPANHDSAESLKDFVHTFIAMTQANRPSDTMTTVELSYNLKAVKKLEDPKHYFEEQQALVKLEEESKARAIERAHRIDAEAFENAPQQTTTQDDEHKKHKKDAKSSGLSTWFSRTRQRLSFFMTFILCKFRRGKKETSPPARV